MALRSEKDRTKAQQEKFQALLSSLLKDEDNKYCEDCDAKGPRWAAWNLGIFLCIRCAGIHRNLGVHISRVKSVNLDSWTPEQIAMMQEIGNSRARAVYEANVPDSFRRPQTDSALEAFIRAKYEHKKYIAREWVPPKPVVPKEWTEDDKADKKKSRSKPISNISLKSGPPSSQSTPAPITVTSEAKTSARTGEPKPAQPPAPKPKTGSDDLLGLDAEVTTQKSGGGQGGDLLADIFGGSPAMSASQDGTQQNFMGVTENGGAETNLFDGGMNGSVEGGGEKKSAKDSIMALYGSGGSQQQMFGVPDMQAPNGLTPANSAPNVGMMGMVMGPGSSMMAVSANQDRIAQNQMAELNTALSSSSSMGGNSGMMGGNSGMMGGNPGMMGGNPSSMGSNSSLMLGSQATFASNAGLTPKSQSAQSAAAKQLSGFTQTAGMMTTNAVASAKTQSTASQMGSISMTGKQQSPMSPSGWCAAPFMYPGAEAYQQCFASHNPYYYAAAGGMYMPQQQVYGNAGMPPMMQQQQGMMGQPMQQGMMGQPMHQGMMGMQQQPGGGMYGAGTQMGSNQAGMMGSNQAGMMGSNQAGMMGSNPAAGMMGRPGGQMFMPSQQQQGVGQAMNPMQQQMQFQQVQQQMANMSMGAGQMGGMQPPQQAAVGGGGGSWGAPSTGQTLSTNLWQ